MSAQQESISDRPAIRRKLILTSAAGEGWIWPAELVTETFAPQLLTSQGSFVRLPLTAAYLAGRTVGSARSIACPGISSVLSWEYSLKSRFTCVNPSWGEEPTGRSIFSRRGLEPVETVTFSAPLKRATAFFPASVTDFAWRPVWPTRKATWSNTGLASFRVETRGSTSLSVVELKTHFPARKVPSLPGSPGMLVPEK